jgi:hypothetical protein
MDTKHKRSSLQKLTSTCFEFRVFNAKFQRKDIQAKSLQTLQNHGKKAKQLTLTPGLTKL